MIRFYWTLILIASFSMLASAQQVLPLYRGTVPNAKPSKDESYEIGNAEVDSLLFKVSRPTISVYLPEAGKANGAAVIICPGGGYHTLLIKREGSDVARAFNEVGVTAGYGWGGGVIVAGEISAQFHGNVVTDNYAPTIGAGLFFDEGAVVAMRNDLIFDNRCPQDARSGTAIYLDGGAAASMLEIENATIANHQCQGGAPAIYIEGGSQAVLKNTILWGNSGEFGVVSGGGYAISYSVTQQPGQGNLAIDPLFANPASGDYHLRSSAGRYTSGGWIVDVASSPAIDAGDPASDYSLETTPNGGRINLGAYGNTAEASRSGGATTGELIFGNGFE